MEIWVERKPTKHNTLCQFCHRDIAKGDFRVVVRYNGYHQQDSLYAHVGCLQNLLERETLRAKEIVENENINPSRRNWE